MAQSTNDNQGKNTHATTTQGVTVHNPDGAAGSNASVPATPAAATKVATKSVQVSTIGVVFSNPS